MNHRQTHARNFVIMLTAGGDLAEVLEMAKAFGVTRNQVNQLVVPKDEQPAKQRLCKAIPPR